MNVISYGESSRLRRTTRRKVVRRTAASSFASSSRPQPDLEGRFRVCRTDRPFLFAGLGRLTPVKRDFLERLGERVVVFDGAMGTGSMSSACS